MSLPRRNYLANITRVGWDLISEPYDLTPVLGDTVASNSSLGNGTIFVDFSSIESNAVYFQVNVTGIDTTTISGSATLNFTFRSPVSQEYLQGGFFFGGDTPFFIDRGGIRGFDNVFFTDKFSTAHPISADGTWSLIGVIDRSIFETFLDGGTRSATVSFYPTEPLTQFSLSTVDLLEGMEVSVVVRAINSAWAQYENEQGTVMGNVTTSGGNSTVGRRDMVYGAEF
jgi:beta-fructofuranosidase